jgi:hypothetical protein
MARKAGARKPTDFDLLCTRCPLAECDERSPLCLIQIERRHTPHAGKSSRLRRVGNEAWRAREAKRGASS